MLPVEIDGGDHASLNLRTDEETRNILGGQEGKVGVGAGEALWVDLRRVENLILKFVTF